MEKNQFKASKSINSYIGFKLQLCVKISKRQPKGPKIDSHDLYIFFTIFTILSQFLPNFAKR